MRVLNILKREWRAFRVLRRTMAKLDGIDPSSDRLIPDDIEAIVDRYPDNVFARFEGGVTTYREFEARANKVANWALSIGLKSGDAVSLFMENTPDYIAIWFGLSKIGVVTGLINNNLTDDALIHTVSVAGSSLIITGSEQDEALKDAHADIGQDVKVWTLGGSYGEDLSEALESAVSARPEKSQRAGLTAGDLCLLVYTSGTTGLPKAARLTHSRMQSMIGSFSGLCDTKPNDRVYVPLPLYHSTGGICAVGIAITSGASVVLRDKFSVSQFWPDVRTHGVTIFAYIGELCRYLVNAPYVEGEDDHAIRIAFGNGLRPDIWEDFTTRFKLPNIVEFYGSTEGNVSMACFDGTVGAIGRVPGWLEHRFQHIALVKFDVEAEAVVRGEDGLCRRTDPNEVGEALGELGVSARRRFEGYLDEKATEKKILRDVFEKDDMWFRTGDLMRKDEHGYYFFVDRIGDTFRWKGENVSTNEVAAVLSKAPGIATANVYGVPVPGCDGKAGMAAITTQGEIDFATLHSWLRDQLPKYAVPLFLRVQQQAETTGTLKYRKVDLVREGFDPTEVVEPLWYYDPSEKAYAPLTPDAFETIRSGAIKY